MIVIYFALFWLIGIWLTPLLPLPVTAWSIVSAAGLLGAGVYHRFDERIAIVFACLCALGAGGVRTLIAQPVIDDTQIAFYNDSRGVTISGVVVREPDVRDRSINLTVSVDSVTLRDGSEQPVSGLVLVTVPRFPDVPYGARLTARGELATPFEEPEFSYRAFLAREGIHSTMYLPQVNVGDFEGQPVRRLLLNFKATARDTLYQIIADPEASQLNAILLGDDNGMTDRLKEDFRTAGLAHLIVISGFHVSILIVLFLGLAEPVLGPRRAVWFTIVMLIVYAAFVGGSPSITRATIMGVLYLVGNRLLGRPGSSLAALALAAVLITLVNPQTLWNIGFQLSFAATLGLILYASRLDDWARKQLERVVSAETARGWLGAPVRIIMVSLAAQILTVPLVMFHFQQVSIISLVANAVVVPAQPPALLFGGLAIVVGLISPALGQIVGWVAWLFLNYTVNAVRVLAQIPFATLPASISLSTLLLIYVALAGVTWVVYQDMERRQALFGRIRVNLPLRAATGGALVLALLTVAWSNSQPDGLLHVFFFDVGQGDAVFIQTPSGRQLLVDAGYYPSIINEQLGRQMPFWDRSLDMVIATHPDADHVSGLPGVLTRYQVGRLVTDGSGLGRSDIYDAVILKAAEEGVPLHSATAGEIIEIGDGVRLEIVHPGAARNDVSRNDNSVSVRLVYGAFSLLLTGDAEDSAERAMLSQGLPLRSLVYKAGHHGAQTSSSAPFLDVVQPQVAIISAGADNRFGHPHPDVLARLAERGVTVLSTIDLGTIEVISDGSQMWWQSWR